MVITERIEGYKNGENKIEEMIADKKTFTAKVGKSSILLKFIDDLGEPRKLMYADEFKTMKYLGFLSAIKKEIWKNEEAVMKDKKLRAPSETKEYFRFSTKLNDFRSDIGNVHIIEDCYEVDFTAAYYQSAYLKGYLSKETYQKVIEAVPKSERLWLLGAIATSYCITHYEEGKVVGEPKPYEDELLRTAWRNICEHIDYVMMDLKDALEGNFLFYWVDGIYFKGEGDTKEIFDRIRAILWRHGIHFRTKPIEKIEIETTKLGINLKLYKGEEEKTFKISTRLLKEYNKNIFKELCEKENKAVLLQYTKMQSKLK